QWACQGTALAGFAPCAGSAPAAGRGRPTCCAQSSGYQDPHRPRRP
nr:hypothetical protein [Tanacetum cinerariifolium]